MTYRKFKYLGGLKSALDLTVGNVYEVEQVPNIGIFNIADDWMLERYGGIKEMNKRGLKLQILSVTLLNEKYFIEMGKNND